MSHLLHRAIAVVLFLAVAPALAVTIPLADPR